ncbi:hypothetical protein SH668x_001084 [Planctomicrobium sp. SH668]|uniref:hypothetical protein n=1 Tax=Planctomicrobium sp. SH668 TaxID=3448126 RepID=UPI003F5B1D6B
MLTLRDGNLMINSNQHPFRLTLARTLNSIIFWGGLATTSLLVLILTITPRLLEQEQLQDRFWNNANALADLQRETAHLKLVAESLRTDKDFLNRVIGAELQLQTTGSKQIPVAHELHYDSLRPSLEAGRTKPEPAKWVSLLLAIDESAEQRRWLIAATVITALLTLLSLESQFLLTVVRRACQKFSSQVVKRYTAKQTS